MTQTNQQSTSHQVAEKNQAPTITLIGAGLVGSLCAVLLAKRGYNVVIFERRADMREQSMSAGRSINLALSNRGIHTLKQAGLMSQVEPMLTPMRGRMIHDLNGKQHLQPYGQRAEEVIYSVSRGDLNKLCMTAAEAYGNVTIHFNRRCDAIDFDKKQLTIYNELTEQNEQHGFEQVIGTDGSTSSVRNAIHARHSQQNIVEPLGHGYKELSIPPDSEGNFQMEPEALHIWPRGGYMIIALPNKDASFTVTLFMPNEGELSFDSIDNKDRLQEFFKQQFSDLIPLLPNLETEYFNNPTGRLATVRCNPWHYQDLALLIGDAAHAIVPFHGQGMNCGFEDITELMAQIDQHNNCQTAQFNWQAVFSETDKLRQPNGNAIADMAIENYIEMRDSVNDPKFVLQKELAFELEKRWPDQFVPRYSMVMFHRLPYRDAQQRGEIQKAILKELTESIDTIEQVDFDHAKRLVNEQLPKINLNP